MSDEIDAECERILKMSDAEITAHIQAQGEDPEQMVQHMDAIILRAIDSTRPHRALAWCTGIFGAVARDGDERACRFIEEAVELVQAAGIPAETLGKIIERVYSRPAGDLRKELGQAALTLELLACNGGMSANVAAEREFARIQSIPKEEWKRRHDAKVALGIASN